MKNSTKKNLRVLTVCAAVWLMICTVNTAAAEPIYHWYCKRTTDHTQPAIDPTMSFITQYGGYYADTRQGNESGEKVIYLTFDAGYENGNVAKVLDVLKQEQVPGAFFILEHLITANIDLVLRMIEEGHLVCNHTMKHRDMTRIATQQELEEELHGLERIFYEKTGSVMSKYFRPPEGKFSEQMMRFAHAAGYRTIFWSFAYADWDNDHQMPSEKAKKIILDHIHPGAVLLLHPTSATNAAVLSDVIRTLKSEGYRFGTLDELVNS